jgi:TRAP-type uncharacterized transport system fused permease subunit
MPIEMMPLAALTVMLWLLWSDSIRRGKQLRLFYAVRLLLFAAVAGVVVYNVLKYPEMFGRTGKLMSWAAAVVGIIGVVFFFRKLTGPSIQRQAPPGSDRPIIG